MNNFLNLSFIIFNKVEMNPQSVIDRMAPKYATTLAKQTLIFEFPLKLQEHKFIRGGKQTFLQLLEEQYKMQPQYGRFIWTEFRRNKLGDYVQVRCRYCLSVMRYSVSQDKKIWKLVQFSTNHVHPKTARYPYKYVQKVHYKHRNLKMNQESKVEQDCQSNNFTQIQLKLEQEWAIKIKLKSKPQILNQTEKLLNSLYFEYKYMFNEKDIETKCFPDVFITANKLNKAAYRKYGKTICYVVIQNCFNNKLKSFQNKKFSIGIFAGYDNNHRSIIFGLSMSVNQGKVNLKSIFNLFFELMGEQNQTNAVIIEKEETLISALNELKNQKNHHYHIIYDNHAYLNSFKQYLNNTDTAIKNQILKKLSEAMEQNIPMIGKMHINELIDCLKRFELNDALKVLNNQEQISHLCLWAMPNQFIGLARYRDLILKDILKNEEQTRVDLQQCIKIFLEFTKLKNNYEKNTLKYEKFAFQIFFNDEKLHSLRKYFQKIPFLAFMQNYRRAQVYQLTRLTESGKTIIRNLKYNKSFTVTDWECQCFGLEKTGIPCQHLIFIFKLLHPNEDYRILFDPWWQTHQQIRNQYAKLDSLIKE